MLTIRWRALRGVLKDAWPIGLALGAVFLWFGVSWLVSPTLSIAVRRAGTILQVLGLTTVAVGLSKLRRQFGRPSLSGAALAWFRRLAATFIRPQSVTAQVSGVGTSALSGEARVRRVARPGASLEDRVAVLEINLERLQGEVDAKVQENRREFVAVKETIEREGMERRAADQHMAQTVEELAVGGLHLETIGLFWLLTGVLGTSVPDELATVLSSVI